MDDIRDSFSRGKKKIKHRLTGRKRKPDGKGPDTRGERVDPSDSLPRPEPHVVTGGGQDRGGNETNADGQQAHSTDLGRREIDIGGGGSSKRLSDVESAMESGRGREVERLHPSPSTPQIPGSEKLDSA